MADATASNGPSPAGDDGPPPDKQARLDPASDQESSRESSKDGTDGEGGTTATNSSESEDVKPQLTNLTTVRVIFSNSLFIFTFIIFSNMLGTTN